MARPQSRAKKTTAESTAPKTASRKPASVSAKAKQNGSEMAAAPAQPRRTNGGKKIDSPLITQEQIAAKAYAIWEAKGRPMGLDQQNWQEAEMALTGR